MNLKILLCLPLFLCSGLFGCSTPGQIQTEPSSGVSTTPVRDVFVLTNSPASIVPMAKDNYTAVTNAINREDWDALRRLLKPEMRANDYITGWENAAKAGHPVRVGKLIGVETDSKYPLDGKPFTKYTFQLEDKDGTPSPHDLQVLFREEGGKSMILDFWNFGW